MWLLPQLRVLWLAVHLLTITRGAVVRSTSDCVSGESWCQGRCRSDVSDETCCQTPDGEQNLFAKDTVCCICGCCPSGTTCNSEGGCDSPNGISRRSISVYKSTVNIGSLHGVSTPSDTLQTFTVHRTTASSSYLLRSPGSSRSNSFDGETFTLHSTLGAKREPTPDIASSDLPIKSSLHTITVPRSSILTHGTDSTTFFKASSHSVLTTQGETSTLLQTSSGGSGGTKKPFTSGTLTSTLPDGETILSASGIIIYGTHSITVPTVTSPTILTTVGEKFTFLPPPSLPTKANTTPNGVTTTFPDGKTAVSRSGLIIFGDFTITVPTGLVVPTTVKADGETFTFIPGHATPTSDNPTSGELTTTFPDGKTAISRSGLIFLGDDTITVPTALTAPTTIRTGGETFTFLPGHVTSTNVKSTYGELTITFPDGKTAISRSGLIFLDGDTITVPTALTAPTTIKTDGEVFTFRPRPASNTESATTSSGNLPTYVTWPAWASITPVATTVDSYGATSGGSDTPCKLWFFFICIQSNDINIGGWFFHLPPGIYPPGPPPLSVIKPPPGITIHGPLPPWPRFTVGPNSIPTFSSEPDQNKCKTESALICATTSSVEASTTNVASTCATILGCDVTGSAATATYSASATTDSCSLTTVTDFFVSCSSTSCVTTSRSLVTGCTVKPSATTTSVADNGPFCELGAAIPADVIQDPGPCTGCATVSGILVATPIPTDLTSLNVINQINPTDQPTALDARGGALFKRVDMSLITPANYPGRRSQSKFIEALRKMKDLKDIGIYPPTGPPGSTGKGQVDVWKIKGIGIGVTSEKYEFGETPLTFRLAGLSGCTVVFIVSSKGFWAAHWWESTKDLVNSGSSFLKRLDSKTTVERDDEEFNSIAVEILTQPTPAEFSELIVFDSLTDMKASANYMFDDAEDVKIFLFTKARSKNDRNQRYESKINLLKDSLTKAIPGAEYSDLTYVALLAEEKKPELASGELYLQYTPYNGLADDGCTQMAAVRVWAEVNTQAVIEKNWPALEDQTLGLQKRQACSKSSITTTTSVRSLQPTSITSAPPLPKLSSQTTPAGNTCVSITTVTSCEVGPDPAHSDIECVTTTSCAKFTPTSSKIQEHTLTSLSTKPPVSTPSLAPLAVGSQHCWNEKQFPGHGDVYGNQEAYGAALLCDYIQDDIGPKSSPIPLLISKFPTPLFYEIYWISGCETTVATQSGKTPIGSNGSPNDVTCEKLLEGNYNNCNNGGVGGYIDAGCLRYIFQPCEPDLQNCVSPFQPVCVLGDPSCTVTPS